MDNSTLIYNEEQKYLKQVKKVTSYISSHPEFKMLLIAGPSCSGKTTTSQTICSILKNMGIQAFTISIDDYYKDVILTGGEKVGDKDFEALDSIDLDLLKSHLHDLATGKEIDLPYFDFKAMKRKGTRERLSLSENSIAVIEGLHALNPEIYRGFVNEENITSLFLNCVNDKLTGNTAKFPRLLRRLVRDNNFRNASCETTFALWEKVTRGEEKYIFPFTENANFYINTYHSYEEYVLFPFAKRLLADISSKSRYYHDAALLLEYLDAFSEEISVFDVPESSLLREFIG